MKPSFRRSTACLFLSDNYERKCKLLEKLLSCRIDVTVIVILERIKFLHLDVRVSLTI